MATAAIDIDKLHAAAFGGTTPTTVISRAWLQNLHRALTDPHFAVVGGAPSAEERGIRILGAIDAVIQLPVEPASIRGI